MSKKNRRAARRALLTLSLVLVVAVASIGGTLAWLTSKTGDVINTFTYGNVTITLDEAKTNEYGVAVTPEERVTANRYKLVPDHSYTKDPTIHVADESEECWLFVKVENGIANAEAAGDTTIAKQMETLGWTLVSDQTNVYAYNTKVAAGTDVVVFNSFKLANNVDVSQYASAQIKITGYAVQADGNATAAAAWASAPATW